MSDGVIQGGAGAFYVQGGGRVLPIVETFRNAVEETGAPEEQTATYQ